MIYDFLPSSHMHRLCVLLVSIPFSSFCSQTRSCVHVDVRHVWYHSLSLEGHIVKIPDSFYALLNLLLSSPKHASILPVHPTSAPVKKLTGSWRDTMDQDQRVLTASLQNKFKK